jgi:type IV pilus assembly protein PilE
MHLPVGRHGSLAARKRGQRGVTLIELAIVMAVVGILMAIAIPSYRNQMMKTRRSVAQGCMLEAAQYMERWYTDNLVYTGASTTPTCSSDATAFYTITTTIPDATSFTITAAPRAGTPQTADVCGTMTLTQTGAKTAGATTGCWN